MYTQINKPSATTKRLWNLTDPKYRNGLTILELLIASTLSISLIAGVLQLLNGTKQSNQLQDALLHVQENGRYAISVMSEAVYYRGFEGCKRPVSIDPLQEDAIDWDNGLNVTTIVADSYPISNPELNSLRGYEVDASSIWSPAPDTDLITLRDSGDPKPRPNSDIISIYYNSKDSVLLNTEMSVSTDSLVINDDTLTFAQNDLVFIGDCLKTIIFRVSNSPGSTLPVTLEHAASHNSTNSFQYNFGTNAELRFSYIDTYYIGDTNRRTPAGDPVYALYRFRDGTSEEIIEGIELMQIQYGELLNDESIRYVDADDTNLNFRAVHNVRISTLIQSISNALQTDDTKNYRLLDEIIGSSNTNITHGSGKYLRKVFSATVQLRNRS